jgi:acetyl-CoA carboxylase biotin carboxylase subunit
MDYDPLLAKLIGYGSDRRQAIMRLERALAEYFVAGIKTNISLFQRILGDADFQAGKIDTGYLDRLLAKADPAISTFSSKSDVAKTKIGTHGAQSLEKIAVIAAGMFTVLDAAAPAKDGTAAATSQAPSLWKQKGRAEALR